MSIFQYKNYAYFPVLKNASTTYRNFFKNVGWKEIPYESICDHTDIICFGHIQDPNTRHTKGIAEILIQSNCWAYLNVKNLASLFCFGVFDFHTIPISMMYQYHYHKIHWIPLDLKIDNTLVSRNDLTNLFFLQNNLPFKIENIDNRNSSKTMKKDIQNKIEKIKKESNKEYIQNLEYILSKDNKIWKESLRYYNQYFNNLKISNTMKENQE